jgi:hypothetical protein
VKNITDPYCADMDKLRGQGVSLKIANLTHLSEIFQIEYALVNGTFNYDGSGLDCADPAKHPELYQNRTLTDLDILPQDMQIKLGVCPGIQNGISLSFRSQTGYDAGQCETIDCPGTPEMECPFYWFVRTYTDEPSKTCKGEFRGDMVWDLCAGNMISAGWGEILGDGADVIWGCDGRDFVKRSAVL